MATKREWYIVDDDDWSEIYGGYHYGQSYTVGNTGDNERFTVTSVKVLIYREGSPGTLDVAIRAVDGEGLPTGADLSTGSIDANGLTISTDGEWREITMSPFVHEPSTQYALTLKALDGGASDTVDWRYDSGGSAYTGGHRLNGPEWDNWFGEDFMFEIWGTPPVVPLAGTITCESNVPASDLKTTRKLAGSISSTSTTSGALEVEKKLVGTITVESNIPSAPLKITKKLESIKVTGPELVVNGIYTSWTDDDPDNWTVDEPSPSEISEVGPGEGHGGEGTGLCNLYTLESLYVFIQQNITVVVGTKYQLSVRLDKVTAGIIRSKEIIADMWGVEEYNTEGTHTLTFIATGSTVRLRIYRGAPIVDITFDDVSLKKCAKIQSALTGTLTVETLLAGSITAATTTSGALTKYVPLAGTVAATSTTSGTLKLLRELIGTTITIEATTAGELRISRHLVGTVTIESSTAAGVKVTRKIVGTTTPTSTISGALTVYIALAGTIPIQSALPDTVLKAQRKLVGTPVNIQSVLPDSVLKAQKKLVGTTITIQSVITGAMTEYTYLVGTIAAASSTSGTLKILKELIASAAASSTVTGVLEVLHLLVGTVTIESTITGAIGVVLETLRGTIAIHSNVPDTQLVVRLPTIPPFMEKDLIDPYASGAWLWLVQIAIAGQDTIRIARNTEDVLYDGVNFDKFNLQVGEQTFSGDGSIPRVTLRVFQDVNRVIEDLVNETEGALGATVKLIRVNEKWLTSPVDALEFDYDNLASESDTEWVTFTLGIPNPLTQRYPLRIYSSNSCPWATPTLFKDARCQYTGGDGTCTGTYEDCYVKGNAAHWGAEIGLDPNCVKV